MARGKGKAQKNSNGAPIGYEAQLWQMADALRNNMDAAEYKHVVLGLLFLKYVSDAFEANHAELEDDKRSGADPEDPDEYRAVNIFWVPKEARWQHLKASAPQPTIGRLVDDAMTAIERDNPSLKGVLPKEYVRPGLDKQRLGQLINLVSDIALGSAADRAKDTLGWVYDYFLSQFASADGRCGGRFYTPSRVVQALVGMLATYKIGAESTTPAAARVDGKPRLPRTHRRSIRKMAGTYHAGGIRSSISTKTCPASENLSTSTRSASLATYLRPAALSGPRPRKMMNRSTLVIQVRRSRRVGALGWRGGQRGSRKGMKDLASAGFYRLMRRSERKQEN